jgi:Arc/MetJ-type ribon-helix-helix transcriptional regulator
MKLSVSLPDDDVAFLDEYARIRGYPSRSAALHAAVRSLRSSTLGDAYAAAWAEGSAADEALWDATVDDGLDPA